MQPQWGVKNKPHRPQQLVGYPREAKHLEKRGASPRNLGIYGLRYDLPAWWNYSVDVPSPLAPCEDLEKMECQLDLTIAFFEQSRDHHTTPPDKLPPGLRVKYKFAADCSPQLAFVL